MRKNGKGNLSPGGTAQFMSRHTGSAGETAKRPAIRMEVRQAFPCASPCPLWLKVCLTVLGMVTLVSCSRGTDAQPKEFDQISSQIKTSPPAPSKGPPPDSA